MTGGRLPHLPLLLWKTPPGLELVLRQEGIPFVKLASMSGAALELGRFVVFDGRATPAWRVESAVSSSHALIDLHAFRAGEPRDPWAALVDDRSGRHSWNAGACRVTERVCRVDRAALRHRLLACLREAVHRAGGLWVRLAPYPHPYRSVFGFRVDLDEPVPGDYFRFAASRRPVDEVTTHFVSTAAYAGLPDVLRDLRGRDVQSHGHHHVVHRDPRSNRENLARADRLLRACGFRPSGFAAPEGRWNAGLDGALEELGYAYSSDFSIGRDDLPFFPWVGERFSKVIQVPIHPVCEGIFFDAGVRDEHTIARYFRGVVRSRLEAGEPAFVYGHPERRLALLPGLLAQIDSVVSEHDLVWRATMTRFAEWWRWRDGLRWTVTATSDGAEIRFQNFDRSFTPALEVVRGRHVASLPVREDRVRIPATGLAFERRRLRADGPAPVPTPSPFSLRHCARRALDWETVTPVEEVSTRTWMGVVRKGLRRLRASREGARA